MTEGIRREHADNGFNSAMLKLAAELEALAKQQYVQAVFIAVPYAMAGNAGKAVEWLEIGFEHRDPQMHYVGSLGGFHKITKDPGYQRILAKMNLSAP